MILILVKEQTDRFGVEGRLPNKTLSMGIRSPVVSLVAPLRFGWCAPASDVTVQRSPHPQECRVIVRGQPSPKELRLLTMHESSSLVTRNNFIDQVWGVDFVGIVNCDVHILLVTGKIEPDPSHPEYVARAGSVIDLVRGVARGIND